MKELEYPFDSDFIIRKKRTIKRMLLMDDANARIKKKIAVLGGSTTHDIKEILELFLLNYGIEPEFYESDYAQYWNDVMFDQPSLKDFQPDIIYIHTTSHNIVNFPVLDDSTLTIDNKLIENLHHFQSMWDKIENVYHCPIIQNNFEMPYYRLLGNRDAYDNHGRVNFINRLNMEFNYYAQQHNNFYINDINYLSACYGLLKWDDPFYWHMYKYALAVPAIPELAYNIANIIKSIFGKNKKTLVLDLDNTLWGGIIGEDGVNNIEMGQETPLGQIYSEFQEYVKSHKELGILLNINSKNDNDIAVAGLMRPDSILKPDDFIVIKANWEPKNVNMVEIAKEINLGLDSMVFIDDNPAERQIVSSQFPEVAVPELEGPESYIRIIDRAGFFEMTNYSQDDLKRNELYKANKERKRLQTQYLNYKDYLLSLEMVAEIEHITKMQLNRIVQLINKTNQFNLTTKRFTISQVEGMIAEEETIMLYGRLRDRFGDNGIVSVIIARRDGDDVIIELFLMSCRVLKRDLEKAMLDKIVIECMRLGVKRIIGNYYPTSKNQMVKKLYGDLGFEKTSEDSEGNSRWVFDISDNYILQNSVIEVKEN